jgi:hypothetical protein
MGQLRYPSTHESGPLLCVAKWLCTSASELAESTRNPEHSQNVRLTASSSLSCLTLTHCA